MTNLAGTVVIGGSLLWLLLIIISCSKRSISVDERQAMLLLLSRGVELIYKGWRLYRTGAGEYTLLYFDFNGNLENDREKHFKTADEAIEEFCLCLIIP
jgi:hypothetical protein